MTAQQHAKRHRIAGQSGSAKPSPTTRPARQRAAGNRVLLVLATLLAGSGLVRIGDGVGRAMAEQPVTPATATPPESAPDAPAALIAALKAREAKIAEAERRMGNREAALQIANTRIDERLKELADAEAKLASTVAVADSAAENDIGKLVSVYENMKPKDAAPLFQEMNPDFAAGFLSRMRPESAAAIMAGIDPQKAYMISVVLAGRNANAPKN